MYFVQLQYVKHQVKEQILIGVPQQVCTVIENTGRIRWEEEGEEFSLNGDMYDVVATKTTGGKTWLYCLNDRNENELLRNFTRLFSSGSEKGKSSQTDVKFHVTDQYVLDSAPVLLTMPVTAVHPLSGIAGSGFFFGEIQLPPPRPVC